jgi:hypothetical protein
MDADTSRATLRALAEAGVSMRLGKPVVVDARVKTRAYKAGETVSLSVRSAGRMMAVGAGEVARPTWQLAKFAGKFAGNTVVGTAGMLSTMVVGTVATGYETVRDFAQGLLHFPNA